MYTIPPSFSKSHRSFMCMDWVAISILLQSIANKHDNFPRVTAFAVWVYTRSCRKKRPFHLSLSEVHSSLIFQAFMSFLQCLFISTWDFLSSRALPLHLHFGSAFNVFCSISSFRMRETFCHSPSHDHPNRFQHCFLQHHSSDVPVGSHTLPIAPSSSRFLS